MVKLLSLCSVFLLIVHFGCSTKDTLIFEETDGVEAGETEHFVLQKADSIRKWYINDAQHPSGILPENFSNIPGKVAFLNYESIFQSSWKIFVWVRAYSKGSEDNGIISNNNINIVKEYIKQ